MTRVILHLAKAIVTVVTAILLFSCGLDMKRVDGSGNVIKQERNASPEFNAVSASGDVEVIIEQGTQRSITVEADDNLQEHIKTEIKGGKLEISTDANFNSPAARTITVVLPEVKEIESSASARVKNRNVLKAGNLALHTSSGSNMELSIDSYDVTFEASSGSMLKVSGKAGKVEASTSSGASIDASGVIASQVRAEASSGGTTIVNPVDELKANASSGGNVQYVKTPTSLSKDVSSGGNVFQQ